MCYHVSAWNLRGTEATATGSPLQQAAIKSHGPVSAGEVSQHKTHPVS